MLSKISPSFLNQVNGTLAMSYCEILEKTVGLLTEKSVILDLNCGEGRSTLSMAFGLDSAGLNNVSILAVDSHVTNPLSPTPHEDGTIIKFLKNMRTYNALHRVVPMLMPVSKVPDVLNRKCANMVVIQCPDDIYTMCQYVEIAKYALRVNGIIVIATMNWMGIKGLLPDSSYALTCDLPGLRIYKLR